MTTPTDPTDPTATRPEAGPDFDTPLADDEWFEVTAKVYPIGDGPEPELSKSVKRARAWSDHPLNRVRRVRLAPSSPPSGGAPGERETDAQEAGWFRWLRDNPQAAAFTAAMVARLRPHGPDLGATMASGEVVGVMEDEKNPGYRYEVPAALPREATGVSEAMVENVARRYVPENNGGVGCGDAPNLLSLADRMALVRAGAALDAGRTP